MSEILTRLLLDTKGFDNNLKKAKKSTDDFSSSITGKLGGAMTKLAGGLGVAITASEAFDRVIRSSQATGDKYAETLDGLKRGVDEFFSSLGTGDFSAFNTGLEGMIAKAREAYRAMDQLGNAQMSFDIAQALAQRSIQEGQLTAKNKFAPVDVAVGGFETWRKGIDDMTAKVGQLTNDTQDYIRKAVESVAGVKGFTANMDNIMMGLLLDIQEGTKRSKLKETYASQYKEYKNALSEASKLLRTGSKTEAEIMWDRNKYTGLVKELNEKYNEAITVNALLNKYGDDELRAIGSNVKNMIALDSSISGLKREFNETAFEFNNRNKNLRGFVPIESYDGYTVYSGTSTAGTGGSGTKSGKAASAKSTFPVVIGQVSYSTPIGEKMLRAMNGEKFEPIEVPIVIDEQVDEEDLSGNWAKHLEKIENMNEALRNTGDIFGSLGGIMGSFGNDMGAWIMNSIGSVANMIAELQSLATARGVAEAASKPFPFNLAAMATVVATIASIFSSLPKFAEGGVVGGSSYFGDKLIARVNSGETILTQNQAARALSMMNGGNVRVTGDVRLNGKDIYISLRNYMSASGNKL